MKPFISSEWELASEIDENQRMVKFVIFKRNEDGSRHVVSCLRKVGLHYHRELIHVPKYSAIDNVCKSPTLAVSLKAFEKLVKEESGDANP